MRYGKITTAISLLTFTLSVLALIFKGLHLGVDFTGGTVMELRYSQAAPIEQIRTAVKDIGFEEVLIQNLGTSRDVMIRLPVKEGMTGAQVSETVLNTLKTQDTNIELRSQEFVGPQVGQELYENGGLALLLVAAGIIIYLAFRFEWRFAVAAIIANLHDVVIILGVFAFSNGNST